MDTQLLTIVGGVLGFLSSLVVSLIGWLLKQTLEDLRKDQSKLEARHSSRLTELTNLVSEVEKNTLKLRGEMYKEFKGLHDDYVPRRELTEIIQGLKEASLTQAKAAERAAEKNTNAIEKLAGKIEQLIFQMAQQNR